MLSQGFIDDSGSGGDSPFLVLSSLVSTAEQWADFSKNWHAALAEKPTIAYFKMSECESLRGQFEGLLPEERNAKLAKLTDLVVQHSELRFSHLVDVNLFNDILRPVLPKQYRNPYLWAFNAMVSGMGSWMRYGSKHTDQIECIFDRQGKLEKRAGRLYDKARGRPGFEHHHLIREPIRFEDDKRALPLQGADLLAWHVRRYHSVEEPIRESFAKLTESSGSQYHQFIVGEELLSRVARRISLAWRAGRS